MQDTTDHRSKLSTITICQLDVRRVGRSNGRRISRLLEQREWIYNTPASHRWRDVLQGSQFYWPQSCLVYIALRQHTNVDTNAVCWQHHILLLVHRWLSQCLALFVYLATDNGTTFTIYTCCAQSKTHSKCTETLCNGWRQIYLKYSNYIQSLMKEHI